ncbi:MAG: site-specific integrase [Porticoccaceae bacterium]
MSQSPFLNSVREFILVRGYSRRTIDAYLYWIKRFILFHNKAHPSKLGRDEIVDSCLISRLGWLRLKGVIG